MGKLKKRYLWTSKASRLFGDKVKEGEQAMFMGTPVTDRNCLESWLKKGYIVEEGEEHGKD